jgi:PilZ domain
MNTNENREARKDLRQHQRLLVPEGRKVAVEAAGLDLDGSVTVIGLGGMFIRTRNSQHLGATLHLKLVDAFITFEAEGTVRNQSEKGIGVEFTGISPENEQKLKMLLTHLKQ